MSTENPYSAGGGSSSGVPTDPVPLEVGAVLSRSWDLIKENLGVFALGALAMAAPSFVAQVVSQGGSTVLQAAEAGDEAIIAYSLFSLLLSFLAFLVVTFFQLGFFRIFLNLARGEEASIGLLTSEGGRYLSGLGTIILVGLATGFGTILFLIPGIIIGIGTQFALLLVVDRKLSPIDAISESWSLTDGNRVNIFVIDLVLFLLMLTMGCLTLCIGFLFIAPFFVVANVVMYQSLQQGRA